MGDEQVREDFEEFYRAAYGRIVAQLYAVTGDFAEAQEAAQEAFVRAWPRWERIRRYDNPAAWVHTVGYRVAVSRWRRTRTMLAGWLRHGPTGDLPGPDADSVALVAALRQLPEAQRRALVLHHMGGRPVAEIAEEEGVAVGTVKARLSRGRAALAALLADEPSAGGPVPARLRGTGRRANGADEEVSRG